MRQRILEQLAAASQILGRMKVDIQMVAGLEAVSQACIYCLIFWRKILLAGNGGGVADAQHIAGGCVSRIAFDRLNPQAIALTADTSTFTAIGDCYGCERHSTRQAQSTGRKGDVLVAIGLVGDLEGGDVCIL